ncbi:MAG: hypothetical protein JNL45_04860 [Hyphomicrobium sp.]|nr:hypothetical protein [Hyphomicrobium sp.]
MKSKFLSIMGAATLLSTGVALAEPPMSDRAVKQLEGIWITTDGSRTIEFEIKNNHALFSDTVRPGITVTGGYGQGERGAAYQLDYPEKLSCSYNIAFPSQEKGNEMIMTLVAAVPKEQAHRCIIGTLKRSR